MMTAIDETPPVTRSRRRLVTTILAMVAVVVVGAVYLTKYATRVPSTPDGTGGGAYTVVDLRGHGNDVVTVDGVGVDPPRHLIGLRCQRVYSAEGTSICLHLAGVGPTFEATVRTGDTVQRTFALPGVPSRARVSPSGHMVAWTVFVTGHSYSDPGGFSTVAGILDVRSGAMIESLEADFVTLVDGLPYTAADRNFWGVTFAADDRTFYATMGSAGQRWLVRGDLTTRTMVTLRKNIECPSLSPDGARIAFKAPTRQQGRWELAVLEVASGQQTRLPGTAGIDDQAAWLDDATLAYGVPTGTSGSSIFRIPVDGSSPGTLWIPDAASVVPARLAS